MQVPNVLDSLRNNEEPSYAAPIAWTHPGAEWADQIELFNRLAALYTEKKTLESAKNWSAYVENRRTINWQYCLDFFVHCPKQYQTPRQLAVSAMVKNEDLHIKRMQLLYQCHTKQPTFSHFLNDDGALKNLELNHLSIICQDVWQLPQQTSINAVLPLRIKEFLQHYPHYLDPSKLPQHGVGLLMATMLMGVQNSAFAITFGDDVTYYNAACHNATEADILRIIEYHQKNPIWRHQMKNDLDFQWFEPFLQSVNPHHLSFTIYQSLDPTMNLEMLANFIKQQQHPQPAESYALDQILIS